MTIKRDDDGVPIISAWEFLALEEKLALDALAIRSRSGRSRIGDQRRRASHCRWSALV